MLDACRKRLSVAAGPVPRRNRRALLLGAVLIGAAVLAIVYWLDQKSRRETDRQIREALAGLVRGETGGVDPLLKKLAADPARKGEYKLLRGASQVLAGHPREAQRDLQGVQPVGALRAPALYWRGCCLYQLQGPAAAEEFFRILINEHPEMSEAHRFLALIYHDLGAMEACLAELEDVARLQPDDYYAFRLLGLVYREDRNDDAKAIAAYRKALDRRPPPEHRDAILREMAESLVGTRDYAAAQAALDESGEDACTLALRAECLWNLGEFDPAKDSLERALQMNPRERNALFLKASIRREEREPQQSVVLLRTLLEQDPHDYPARYLLAQVLRQLGETEAAAAELSRMEESRSLRDELRTLYREAMKNANDADVRDAIAGLCRRLGKDDLASIWAQAAAQCRRFARRGKP
jgi:tetratricopeptide (TPR) repeat protein